MSNFKSMIFICCMTSVIVSASVEPVVDSVSERAAMKELQEFLMPYLESEKVGSEVKKFDGNTLHITTVQDRSNPSIRYVRVSTAETGKGGQYCWFSKDFRDGYCSYDVKSGSFAGTPLAKMLALLSPRLKAQQELKVEKKLAPSVSFLFGETREPVVTKTVKRGLETIYQYLKVSTAWNVEANGAGIFFEYVKKQTLSPQLNPR